MGRMQARIVGLAGLGLLVGAVATAHADEDPSTTALAVVDAHRGNLDSFERFTCRYTITDTRAQTVEDALAGRYSKEGGPPRTGQFLWARDGNNHSVKVTEDEETTRVLDNPKKKTPVAGRPGLMFGEAVPFMTNDYLITKEHFLSYKARNRTANMWGDNRPYPRNDFLFGCHRSRHCYDPLAQLRGDLERGKVTCSVSRERETGRELVKLTIANATMGQFEYWFDPQRAYLVVRWIHSKVPDNEGTVMRREYPDARACLKGRWFPTRQVHLWQQKHRPDWSVRDTKVTELEADKVPARELFEINIQSGHWIVEDDEPKNNIQTRKPEKIHVDDLADVWKMIHQKPEEPLMDTAIHPERSFRWVWWAVGGVLAATGLSLVGWRFRTSRRTAATTVPT